MQDLAMHVQAYHVADVAYALVCLVIALGVQGDECIPLMEVKVFHDGIHPKFSSPLHTGSIHVPCFFEVMLPCPQKAPQEIHICMHTCRQRYLASSALMLEKVAEFDW